MKVLQGLSGPTGQKQCILIEETQTFSSFENFLLLGNIVLQACFLRTATSHESSALDRDGVKMMPTLYSAKEEVDGFHNKDLGREVIDLERD